MMNKEILLKRLTTIKLLHKIAEGQSHMQEATAVFSILMFHDAVEMFLKLSAEFRNIDEKKTYNFMDYWKELPELTLKESMRNLNKRRVHLKHHGIIPAMVEVEASRVNTRDFLEQNCQAILEINYTDITLSSLIKFEKTKDWVRQAEKSLEVKQIEECIENVTKAFYELMYDYKESKRDWGNKTEFDFVDRFRSPSFKPFSPDTYKVQMTNVLETIESNFKNIETALNILSLGIDYRKYSMFRILTPNATRMPNGEYVLEIYGQKNWSIQNCQFLIDFVIDCALKLQMFDYNFESLDLTDPIIDLFEDDELKK